MVSQHQDGSCTLGDSHEYRDTIEPFDKLLIARQAVDLPIELRECFEL
jgi:hypothetical protein